MSGPKSASFNADPMAVLLAAAAIQAATAVYAGYAQAATLRQQNQERNDALDQRQRDAEETGHRALDAESRAVDLEFDRLIQLAEKLGVAEKVRATRPTSPASDDREASAAHVRAVGGLVAQLRTILLTEAARLTAEHAGMPEFSGEAAARAALPQQVSRRQLARIEHLGAIPESIQKLALELDQTLPGERFDLFATELRAQVQAHLEQQQQRQVQEATSLVVSHTLKELGYQVEDVANTLFVEGGVAHFQRAGWGNYMVRMRVDAKGSNVNFNVVRAVAEGENERSVLDHLAEDRWCAEFPALLQALEVRGVALHVTRHLAAGELPVQLVSADKLPVLSQQDEAVNRANQTVQPLSRKLP
jgi:hypothetical protein